MEKHLLQVLGSLVQENSINTTLADGPGEEAIARFLISHLGSVGIDAQPQEVSPGRFNVVALVPGKDRRRSLLLNAHIDTVGVEGMDEPFSLIRKGDRLHGRGTYDMKGSAAVMVLLAEHYITEAPPIDLAFTWVCDEEDASLGIQYIANHWLPTLTTKPEAGIFLEPTELDIGIRHKGFSWYEVSVEGKAAHGSRPQQGVDAILPLKAALQELSNIQNELEREVPDELLGSGSLHAGTIEGGSALSVIPARANLAWERRTLPEETHDKELQEFHRVLAAVKKVPGDHRVTGRELLYRAPHSVEADAAIVTALQVASPTSKIIGCSFWADTAFGGAAGIPSVLFGPVGHGAHAVDEWVSLESLLELHRVLCRVIDNL